MNKVNRIFMYLLGNRKKSRLPSGYTELEYISNPSTAYINTGVGYSSTDDIDVHIDNVTYSDNHYVGIFGTARAISGTWHRNALVYDGQGPGTYQVLFGQSQQNIASGHMPISNTTIDVAFRNGSQAVSITNNGVTSVYTTSFTDSQSVQLYSVMLFTYNRNGSPATFYMVGDIGNFSLTQNGLKVIDYVPAQRDSDSVVGMYDLVTNTFITSATSVQFVAGPIKQL